MTVAFHVSMSTHKCFQAREPYVFDYKEVDLGNGFNIRDGIYTVPVSGM